MLVRLLTNFIQRITPPGWVKLGNIHIQMYRFTLCQYTMYACTIKYIQTHTHTHINCMFRICSLERMNLRPFSNEHILITLYTHIYLEKGRVCLCYFACFYLKSLFYILNHSYCERNAMSCLNVKNRMVLIFTKSSSEMKWYTNCRQISHPIHRKQNFLYLVAISTYCLKWHTSVFKDKTWLLLFYYKLPSAASLKIKALF